MFSTVQMNAKQFKRSSNDEELFEAIAVTSLFNFMDRMADALGAPVEGLRDMIAEMEK